MRYDARIQQGAAQPFLDSFGTNEGLKCFCWPSQPVASWSHEQKTTSLNILETNRIWFPTPETEDGVKNILHLRTIKIVSVNLFYLVLMAVLVSPGCFCKKQNKKTHSVPFPSNYYSINSKIDILLLKWFLAGDKSFVTNDQIFTKVIDF